MQLTCLCDLTLAEVHGSERKPQRLVWRQRRVRHSQGHLKSISRVCFGLTAVCLFFSMRKDELNAISGPNEFAEFYNRLKLIKEFHRKHPNEVMCPSERHAAVSDWNIHSARLVCWFRSVCPCQWSLRSSWKPKTTPARRHRVSHTSLFDEAGVGNVMCNSLNADHRSGGVHWWRGIRTLPGPPRLLPEVHQSQRSRGTVWPLIWFPCLWIIEEKSLILLSVALF